MVCSTFSRMPLLSCRLLVLSLTMVQPFLAVAGRHIPAAAPMVSTASSTPTPQIELSTAAALAAALTADNQEMEFAVVTWKRGRYYQVNVDPGLTLCFHGIAGGNHVLGFHVAGPLINEQFQDLPSPHINILRGNVEGAASATTIYGHRLLLGSAPPSCQGKCGSCVPCSPIHISLGGPHGSLTQQEYYPEAWRCKCGNRFFMP